MKLRAELMPAELDEDLVQQLIADLINAEDHRLPADEVEKALTRLSLFAGDDITRGRVTAVLTNYSADEWVRTILYDYHVRPATDVTRGELLEVLRRAYPYDETEGREIDEARRKAYMTIFNANVPLPNAAYLIFWPPESWIDTMSGYDPTPEQIVDWIFDPKDTSLLS